MNETSLTPEEKEKMPPYSGKKKEFRENSVLHYERGNKKNIENSDFIGLCNNQDKFNNDKNYFVFGGIILSFLKFNSPVVANRANFA